MRGGQITSRQVVTPHGPVYQVRVDPDATLASAARNGHDRHGDAMAAVPPHLADLVGLVERLHRENVELTGMVGSLQQRLIFADERIRALEAPREPTPAGIAPGRPAAGASVEMAQRSTPTKRTWWLRWLPVSRLRLAAMTVATPPKRPPRWKASQTTYAVRGGLPSSTAVHQ